MILAFDMHAIKLLRVTCKTDGRTGLLLYNIIELLLCKATSCQLYNATLAFYCTHSTLALVSGAKLNQNYLGVYPIAVLQNSGDGRDSQKKIEVRLAIHLLVMSDSFNRFSCKKNLRLSYFDSSFQDSLKYNKEINYTVHITQTTGSNLVRYVTSLNRYGAYEKTELNTHYTNFILAKFNLLIIIYMI